MQKLKFAFESKQNPTFALGGSIETETRKQSLVGGPAASHLAAAVKATLLRFC